MEQPASDGEWTYNGDDDIWTQGAVSIDGVVIRQFARQLIRTRRTRALSRLESRYGQAGAIDPGYTQALVSVLSDTGWALSQNAS